ncbi:MAG: hypothetical protein OXE78_10120 [Gammaproteobacteria bacterium]|nr:hypothetical protein [Gammaproteobacteria bacterium]
MLSSSIRSLDLPENYSLYARKGVTYLWFVDSGERNLGVFKWKGMVDFTGDFSGRFFGIITTFRSNHLQAGWAMVRLSG